VVASSVACRPLSMSDTVACDMGALGSLAALTSSCIDSPFASRARFMRRPKGVGAAGFRAVLVLMRRVYVIASDRLRGQLVSVRLPTMPKAGSGRDPVEHFWSKAGRAEDAIPCWLWSGPFDKDGYGIFSTSRPFGPRAVRSFRAHRFSWELIRGPIPTGKLLMHHCDTPACVNPAHMSIATQLENNRDAFAKGRRRAAGEHNIKAKLTAADASAIRASGERADVAAARYGVNATTIYSIRSGKTWKHIVAETTTRTEA